MAASSIPNNWLRTGQLPPIYQNNYREPFSLGYESVLSAAVGGCIFFSVFTSINCSFESYNTSLENWSFRECFADESKKLLRTIAFVAGAIFAFAAHLYFCFFYNVKPEKPEDLKNLKSYEIVPTYIILQLLQTGNDGFRRELVSKLHPSQLASAHHFSTNQKTTAFLQQFPATVEFDCHDHRLLKEKIALGILFRKVVAQQDAREQMEGCRTLFSNYYETAIQTFLASKLDINNLKIVQKFAETENLRDLQMSCRKFFIANMNTIAPRLYFQTT